MIYDLYCSPPDGDNQCVLASLLASTHVVHLYIQSLVSTGWASSSDTSSLTKQHIQAATQ